MAKQSFIGSADYNRKDNRIEEPAIYFMIEGDILLSLDWGLGGFRVGSYKGSIRSGQEFLVEGIGPNPGLIFIVRVDCEAVRMQDEELAATFAELSSDAYDILEALMMRRQKPIEKLKERLETKSWEQTGDQS